MEADITMKTINIDGVKVAYKITYYLNCAVVTIYVKHRVGQSVKSNKAIFENYKEYSRCTISVSTTDCDNEYKVIAKTTKDMKITKYVKIANSEDRKFIEEIFKALE